MRQTTERVKRTTGVEHWEY